MTCSNNVIEYSIGDTINTPVHFHTDMENGSTMRFVIAVDDTSSPIIDKVFNMNSDGAFTIELTLAERSILKLGKYIYKAIVNGIDGSIRTCQSGYFIVTWFAARDNVINLSAGYKPLVFDATPTQGSSNPVTSDGIYKFVKENSSGGESYTFDDVPTLGSKNPVTSDGIKLYVGTEILNLDGYTQQRLDNKIDKVDSMGLARVGDMEEGHHYIAYQDSMSSQSNVVNVYSSEHLDELLHTLKLQSVPHTTASGYPLTVSDALVGEKLISCTIHGVNGGVGDLQENGSYKIPVKVSGKNLFDYTRITGSNISQIDGGLQLTGYGCATNITPEMFLEMTGLKEGDSCIYTNNYELLIGKFTLSDMWMGSLFFQTKVDGENFHIRKSSTMSHTIPDNFNSNNYKPMSIYGALNAEDGTAPCVYLTEIQLERGNAATSYESYVTPSEDIIWLQSPLYEGDTAEVTGLTTVDSSVNTITAMTKVVPSKIDAEYYQDINKVITELKNAILAQGGNV